MSIADFLTAIENYDGRNLEPVEILLKYNHSLINKVHNGLNPLSTALRNKNCSVEIIKLLFLFGAKVNYIEKYPSIACSFGPLCTALQNVQSIDVIKLLIDSWKFSKDVCKEHLSDMNCIMKCSNSRLKEGIFKLLIEQGQNIDDNGKLLLCKALEYCTKAHDIELLLNAGASLNGCMEHISPFDCATSCTSSVQLKSDVIKVLIDAGAVMGEDTANSFTPLENALFYREYETKAIQLLLELQGTDLSNEKGANLLHLAVQNASCKASAVKLLLDYGAPVNIPNEQYVDENTELHNAIRGCSQPSIIDILVKSGSHVNRVNGFGDTPLTLVAKSLSFPHIPTNQQDITRILLRAGARIDLGRECDCNETDKCIAYVTLIRVWVFSCLNTCENGFECFKLLAKYLFLQCPEFELDGFLKDLCDQNLLKKFIKIKCNLCAYRTTNRFYSGVDFFKVKLLNFIHSCICELHTMNSVYVADGLTLYEFINRHSLHDNRKEVKYDLDKLLKILSVYTFPEFFDVITSKVDRLTMETKLQKVLMYALKICPGLPCTKKKVILDYESILRITSFLPDEDFLKLLAVAFYNSNGHVDRDSEYHEIANKNNLETGNENIDLTDFIPKKLQFVSITSQTGQNQFQKLNEKSFPPKHTRDNVRKQWLGQIPSFFPDCNC